MRACAGRSARGIVALVGLSALMAGCSSPISPTSSVPFSQTDLMVGSGEEAVTGSFVTVEYTGWFYDASQPDQKGAQFDTSAALGQPFSFTLGAGQVIAGWDRGIVGMRVGGLRRLVIPPSLAYGPRRVNIVPPNATLLFEIELLSVGLPGGE